jgi:hypothetical protein
VTYLFWVFLVCFMMVLSKWIWVATGILLLGSFWLFSHRYYNYESTKIES